MKNEIPVLEALGPVPFWRGTEKCREALAEMYRKAMRAAEKFDIITKDHEKQKVHSGGDRRTRVDSGSCR